MATTPSAPETAPVAKAPEVTNREQVRAQLIQYAKDILAAKEEDFPKQLDALKATINRNFRGSDGCISKENKELLTEVATKVTIDAIEADPLNSPDLITRNKPRLESIKEILECTTPTPATPEAAPNAPTATPTAAPTPSLKPTEALDQKIKQLQSIPSSEIGKDGQYTEDAKKYQEAVENGETRTYEQFQDAQPREGLNKAMYTVSKTIDKLVKTIGPMLSQLFGFLGWETAKNWIDEKLGKGKESNAVKELKKQKTEIEKKEKADTLSKEKWENVTIKDFGTTSAEKQSALLKTFETAEAMTTFYEAVTTADAKSVLGVARTKGLTLDMLKQIHEAGSDAKLTADGIKIGECPEVKWTSATLEADLQKALIAEQEKDKAERVWRDKLEEGGNELTPEKYPALYTIDPEKKQQVLKPGVLSLFKLVPRFWKEPREKIGRAELDLIKKSLENGGSTWSTSKDLEWDSSEAFTSDKDEKEFTVKGSRQLEPSLDFFRNKTFSSVDSFFDWLQSKNTNNVTPSSSK